VEKTIHNITIGDGDNMEIGELKRILNEAKSIIAVHHWDADGISSAAIIMEHANNCKNYCPPIGSYKVTNEVVNELLKLIESNKTTILVLDWNIPFREVDILENEVNAKVVMIDHHYKTEKPNKPYYYNPVALGGSEEDWPSTTWVLKWLLNHQVNLKVLLGLFGDLEVKALELKLYEDIIRGAIEDRGLNINELIEASKILNSLGRIGNRKLVERAPSKLVEYGENLKRILRDREWINAWMKLRREVEQIMSSGFEEELGGIIIKRFSSKMNVTSEIARRLAEKYRDRVIVAVNEDGPEIYVRRGFNLNINLTPIINELGKLSAEIGGKESVIGIRIKREHLSEILDKVINIIGNLIWR